MFRRTRRQLALLNVGLLAAILAVVVVLTYAALKTSLDREADRALDERIDLAARTWEGQLETVSTPVSTFPAVSGDDDHEDDEDDEDDENDDLHEAIETGDILVFVFDANGTLIVDERDVATGDLPLLDDVADALDGETRTRTAGAGEGTVRVRTRPVLVDDVPVGVIQAVRSDREHQAELALVRNIGLVGLGLGLLIAFPAGLYLSRRAMDPISLVFDRQRAFVADAAHELKTPLAVIRANVELVARDPGMAPGERTSELRHVLAEVDGMARLVDTLVDLARLDRPRDGLAHAEALATAREVVRSMQPLAQDAGLTLTVTGSEGSLRIEAEALQQLLRIVLDNAIAYSEPGGTVTVAVTPGAPGRITVTDTGVGISPADLPHVFDRFWRAEHSRSRRTGGAGLGLAIARAIVEAAGGTIELASTPGTGTTVMIEVPVADAG